MKKILLCLLLILSMFNVVACGSGEENTEDTRPTFTVGMECAYAPFNWTEYEKTDTNYPIEGTKLFAEGYDVQISKMIADALDYRLVIKAIEWDGLIAALETGQIDAVIAGMTDTEERRISVDFTAAYYRSTHVLLTSADSEYVNGKTLNDFVGADVVGQVETLYDSLINQLTGVNHLIPLSSVPEIITALTNNRADITILEEPVAKGIVESDDSFIYVTLTEGFQVSPQDVEVAIATNKQNVELTSKISAALNNISEAQRNELMNQAIERNSR
jgi:ABC-type amino acid transport substrate-binding protein